MERTVTKDILISLDVTIILVRTHRSRTIFTGTIMLVLTRPEALEAAGILQGIHRITICLNRPLLFQLSSIWRQRTGPNGPPTIKNFTPFVVRISHPYFSFSISSIQKQDFRYRFSLFFDSSIYLQPAILIASSSVHKFAISHVSTFSLEHLYRRS